MFASIKVFFVVALLSIALSVASCVTRSRGVVIEYVETENAKFSIRVAAILDDDIFKALAGATYVFSSSNKVTGATVSIMDFHHDNAVPIPRDNIRFLADDIAYVFMHSKYAVTTNAGNSWSVWDGSHQVLAKRAIRYDLIQRIDLSPAGHGTMMLRQGVSPSMLFTNDYGVTWKTAE